MRMSCNGCRVLRKGCSDKCTIRPCLQWIRSSDSQANATVFLAKFFGRAGLMNLINSGPENLRPAIFRSLLYEACGRIVNPIYGAVGLLWSGNWQLCQNAVEAVLKGSPITPITSEAAASGRAPPLKAYDIRHVSKGENSAASNEPPKVKTRGRHRRSPAKPKEANPSPSHESSVSHQSEAANESMVSVEMAEASLLFGAEQEKSGAEPSEPAGDGEIGLELTLGLEPGSRADHVVPVKKRRFVEPGLAEDGACKIELGLDCSA